MWQSIQNLFSDKDVGLLTDTDLAPYATKHLHTRSPSDDANAILNPISINAQPSLNFEYNHIGLTSVESERLLLQYGKNQLPEKVVPKWYIFVSQLWQPMPIMIWIAAFIEACIQNWIDMVILLFIQFANASIGYYEITKAGDAVTALKSQLQAKATVKRDGIWKNIPVSDVVPGDLVLLAAGSAIPADCRVNEGQIEVDQAALTGESLPVTMYKGDAAKMGSTVVRGEQEGTVEFTGSATFLGKTASLLHQTSESSNLQKILITITTTLVLVSIFLCTIVLIYLSTQTNFTEALSFTVVLLVASIPLAIEIVTTTTLALGSKEMTRDGAIVTRLAAIEDLAGMAILCSDKTGTLTLNKMVIQDETPVYVDGMDQYKLLYYAVMAAKWHEPARDALDTMVLNKADIPAVDAAVEQTAYMPFDPITKRTEGTVRDKATGQVYKTTKGAPHVLIKLVRDGGHADELSIKKIEHDVHAFGLRGIRCLAVAKTTEGGWFEMLGLLTFLDPPRPDTKHTIQMASFYGVTVKMITGDHLLIACETARQLGMGDYIKSAQGLPILDPETKKKPDHLARDYGDACLAADGFAQVFPEHKYLIVECLRELGYKVGMTGDGVNDAPALKRADVGVAVLGCTDAARAASDIVLTKEGLSTIVTGIIVSRRIFARIRNFIIYRIAATLQLLVFFFVAVLSFHPNEFMPSNWQTLSNFPDSQEWPTFYHMPVIMLMLITLLNDGTLIAIGYDNVAPRDTPETWNLKALFSVSCVLALIAFISSIILLYLLLNSWNSSYFNAGLSYGQVTTSIYLKISISDFLTLFSARTGPDWFWKSTPSMILLLAAAFALTLSTILALSWPSSTVDDVYTLGLARREPYVLVLIIWLYCIAWFFFQDICKVLFYKIMQKYNLYGWNNTGAVIIRDSTKFYIENNMVNDMELARSQHSFNTH